ncbi:MAG: phosphatase PAP2 family protein [Candidatus Azobacteroides sp.]|nr:phosphatase PAP2 family protein [Candidatus Azobacteroides sp.]
MKKNQSLKEESIYIGASVSISFLSSWILKDIFDRNRPYKSHPVLIKNDEEEDSYSFPSSHSSVAFALATALTLKYPKWYIITPSYFWATSVGFSRIQKGVHYPSDVIAGALLEAGSAFVCYELNKWIKIKTKNNIVNTTWLTYVY